MFFANDQGRPLGLVEAAIAGFPSPEGFFTPSGESDLRQAIYSPEASYVDTAAMAIAALFPEEFDPLRARRIAERAFRVEPPGFAFGEDILVLDLAGGPSASAADSEASFLAAIAAYDARHEGRRLLIADGSGPEGAALSEAVAGLPELQLVLLYPEGRAATGIRPARLVREGGETSLLGIRASPVKLASFLRCIAGSGLGGNHGYRDKEVAHGAFGGTEGARIVAAGPENPARLIARIVALAAAFALLRRGTVGDLYIGLRPDEGFDLAAGLWAWRFGLPFTGLLVPENVVPIDCASRFGELPASGELPAFGSYIAACFDRDMPGALRSLILGTGVGAGEAQASAAALTDAGGPSLDPAAASILAAAERCLSGGMRGHARFIVPRSRHPYWAGSGGLPPELGSGLLDARKDAELGATIEELQAFLSSLA